MTSQLLIRTDSQVKEAFKSKAKAQWVSMDYLLNVFIHSYIEKPDIVHSYVDDDVLDAILTRSISTPQAKSVFASLHKTLQSKWL